MNLVIWSLVLLLSGAGGCLALGYWRRLSLGAGCAAIVIGGVAEVVGAVGTLLNPGASPQGAAWSWPMPLGQISLELDGLSAWFTMALGMLSTAVGLYCWGCYSGEGTEARRHDGTTGKGTERPANVAVAMSLICVLLLSILLVFCAGNVIVFVFGWEMMSLAAFLLISLHNDRDAEVRRAAWTYLVATHIGTALGVFPLLAILVGKSGGETSFAGFSSVAAAAGGGWCLAFLVMGFVGFGAKAGFMPMHVWLPVVYPASPGPVAGLMSGIVSKCGLYGFLRLLGWLPPLPAWCGMAVLGVGAVGGVMGILYAIGQQNLKRMLAYSSVENVGIIAIGIGMGMMGRSLGRADIAALGFAGALLHVLNHSMFKGLLFLSAGAVRHDAGTGLIERLGGLARRTPGNAWLFLLAAVAICGLPPLNGFASEWLIYRALFEQATSTPTYAVVPAVTVLTALALVGGLAVAAFAKVFAVVFLGNGRDVNVRVGRTPKTMLAGMSLLAAGCVSVAVLIWLLPPRYRLLDGVVASMMGDSHRPALAFNLPGGLVVVIGVLVALAVALALLRKVSLRLSGVGAKAGGDGPLVVSAGTWGCGYAYPTARIQYTGSSFGWSLAASFRQVLFARRQMDRPRGWFGSSASLATQSPDVTMTRFYEPVFSAIASSFQRLWPLQHGRIQLYLLYIVAMLLIVFFVESCWHPGRPSIPPTPVATVRGEHR